MKLTFLLVSLLTIASATVKAETTVHLEEFMGRGRVVHASVGGRSGTFLFDTGGGITNVTPAFAAAIGCKPWGRISGFTMTGQRLDMQRCDHETLGIGTTTIPLETIGVFDGNGMMPPDAPHLDGTIALDAFVGRALAFSYAAKTLAVLTPDELRRAASGRTALPLHVVRDAEGLALSVNLPVETSAGTAWFELDAGNVTPFSLVGEHLAGLMNLKQGTRDTQKLEARLTDGTRIDGDAKVLGLTLDGNLGTAFLTHYDVLLDLTSAKVWLIAVERKA